MKHNHVLTVTLALASTFAVAQMSPGGMQQPGGMSTGTPGTAATPGSTASTPQTSSTGAVGSNTATTATTTSSTTSTASESYNGILPDAASLQGQIKTALDNNRYLSNNNISVNVTNDKIVLSGSVSSGKDKQNAKRIAESFAGWRKVVDRMTVSSQGQGANAPSPQSGVSAPSGSLPAATGTSMGSSAGTTAGSATGVGNSTTGQPSTPPPPR